MSKAYKGHELLKEIANGNIKEGTQFKNLNENPMYDNRNIYVYKNNNLIGRFGGMNIIAILNDDFEIIEEEPEIDEIGKMAGWALVSLEENIEEQKESINFTLDFFGKKINEIITNQNKIVKAVNQINNK